MESVGSSIIVIIVTDSIVNAACDVNMRNNASTIVVLAVFIITLFCAD